MKHSTTLSVNIPEKNAYSYDIIIGSNLLGQADEIIKNYTKANKFLVVTNETVAKLYKEKFNLQNADYVILPDGEEYKNFDSLQKILDKAVENRFERKDCIVALGGGVVGDMSGLAAAVYMRGIDFVQVPTTLLAMVDSSVGGKVAINHTNGKNLIGAFYQPKVVLADISTLKTLDERQFKTGLGEVLKYAFIEKSCNAKTDFNFFEFLQTSKDKIYSLDEITIVELVKICCTLKSAVVNQDETEKGLRAILNLGHTFAHAIENLTSYTTYTHGEAVTMGLISAFELALSKNLITKDYYDKAVALVYEYQITKNKPDIAKEEFYDEMFLDKKAQNGKVRFVLPNGLFSVDIFSDIEKNEVISCL